MEVAIPNGLSAEESHIYDILAKVIRKRTSSKTKPRRILVITDLAKDYDDLAAMVLLKELHRLGLIQLLGFVANLQPARDRARFGRGALDTLGLNDIPIAEGTKGSDIDRPIGKFEFDCDFMSPESTVFEDGQILLQQICSMAAITNEKITLLLLSSLSDITAFAQKNGALLRKVTSRVVLQGGYVVSPEGQLTPDDKAANNRFDLKSATYFHKFLQDSKIPSTVYTKNAAYATPLTATLFASLDSTDHPLGRHLRKVQVSQDVHYYVSASDPETRFQNHMDQEWFLRHRSSFFESPQSEDEYPVGEEVVPFLTRAVMYDVLAALGAAGDDVLDALGVLRDHTSTIGGFIHRIVGESPENTGIYEQRMADTISVLLKGSLLASVQGLPST